MADDKPHASGQVDPGNTSTRVGMEVLRERGLDPEELREKLIDAIGAEFTTYYYYTNLRMHLAGHEDYKEITEDARLEDRAHFELVAPRVYELGGSLPNDIRDFADPASCPDAEVPTPMDDSGGFELNELNAEAILEVLLEAERCAIRTWSEVCDMTQGVDPAPTTWPSESSRRRSNTRRSSSNCSRWSATARSTRPATSSGANPATRRYRRTGDSTTAPESAPTVSDSWDVEIRVPADADSEFAGESRTITVGEDESILAAARADGLWLSADCQQGWCVTCAARLLSGTVDQRYARRYYSEDEAAGFVLTCVAKPRSDVVLVAEQEGEMLRHRADHDRPPGTSKYR